MLRVGVVVRNEWPISVSVEYAKKAERLGFDSVWANSYYSGRDPFVTLSAIARETERVRLGTAIVDLFARHPVALASSILSLHELSGGRADLGVSPGGFPAAATSMGYEWKNLLARTRQGIEIIKKLTSGEAVTYQGSVFKVNDVRMFRSEGSIRVFVAAEGPKMLQLAAEVADGLLAPKGPPKFNKHILETFLNEARSKGRAPWETEVIMEANPFVAADKKAAIEMARPYIAEAVSHLTPPGMELIGVDQAKARVFRREPSAVPDELVESFAICGTVDDCLDQMKELEKAGLNELYLWYPDLLGRKFSFDRIREHERLMQAIGEQLLPALRR